MLRQFAGVRREVCDHVTFLFHMPLVNALHFGAVRSKLLPEPLERRVRKLSMPRALAPLLTGQTKKHARRDEHYLEADFQQRFPNPPGPLGRVRFGFVEMGHMNIRHGQIVASSARASPSGQYLTLSQRLRSHGARFRVADQTCA